MKKNVVVTGGGTGGHIFPAVAVARALEEKEIDLIYLGKKAGMEEALAKEEGLAFVGIQASGLVNMSFKDKLGALGLLFKGVRQVRRLLKEEAVDLVFATGGYVSMAAILAAYSRAVPLILHEQNAYPGLVNRLGSLFAKRVCITFEDSRPHFYKKKALVYTGLPIRQSFLLPKAKRIDDLGQEETQKGIEEGRKGEREEEAEGKAEGEKKEAGKKKTGKSLLVLGGSQGAKPINDVILDSLAGLKEEGYQLTVLTGRAHYDDFMRQLKKRGISREGWLSVMAFSSQIAHYMKGADLVIGRAGASFIAESYATGLPSILVPFPQSANNHQLYNARAAEKAGAALLIEQKDWNRKTLMQALDGLDTRSLEAMSEAARSLANLEAVDRIIEEMTPYL